MFRVAGSLESYFFDIERNHAIVLLVDIEVLHQTILNKTVEVSDARFLNTKPKKLMLAS